jgi:hypothetical protein
MCFALLGAVASASPAQVAPSEILNPELRALETEYLQKLIALNHQISAAKFPFSFALGRYVDVDPKDQPGNDTRGLEFVRFHERVVLKCSGNYNAAFSAKQWNRNQRADRVFADVIAPVLRLIPEHFREASDFEGFGFEISYHVRDASGKSDFEGRENLVAVFSVPDALKFSQLNTTEERQSVLNGSEIYVSGQRYGLALGKIDPLTTEEIARPPAQENGANTSSASAARTSAMASRLVNGGFPASATSVNRSGSASIHPPSMLDAAPVTPADINDLETKYQSALEDYGKFIDALMHQPGSAPPSLATFRNHLYLQITLKNPEAFDPQTTSLYKRAALSFDTFLAPHLGDLLSRLPSISNLAGINITVLERLNSTASSAEAVEFMCSLPSLRDFATFDLSSQDLVDQSLVIVNNVRITLNLQQVE